MGLTTSGSIGAQIALTQDDSVERIQNIVNAGREVNPDIFVLCHGGPIAEPEDAKYVIERVEGLQGFFGASRDSLLKEELEIKPTNLKGLKNNFALFYSELDD